MDLIRLTPASLADRLGANAQVFRHLVGGTPPGEARWRPSPAAWSLIEVVNHLADEEAEDFRIRVRTSLDAPDRAWDPIRPAEWVMERDYQARELEASLERFLEERRRSGVWLRTLQPIDPEATGLHPVEGPIRVTTLLHSWLAHDLLHIRQITRLRYRFLAESGGPETVGYAGDW
jgi:hypothetical protein